MAAIIIRPAPYDPPGVEHIFEPTRGAVDWMPFTVRLRVARELNALWAEFVTDMHDGPPGGPEVADKFWQFVSTRGRPS
jgi:hypothetical protein